MDCGFRFHDKHVYHNRLYLYYEYKEYNQDENTYVCDALDRGDVFFGRSVRMYEIIKGLYGTYNVVIVEVV